MDSPRSFCLGSLDFWLHAKWQKTCQWQISRDCIIRRFRSDRPYFRESDCKIKYKTKFKKIECRKFAINNIQDNYLPTDDEKEMKVELSQQLE